MAVASASPERILQSPTMDRSAWKSVSEAGSESASSVTNLSIADSPDRSYQFSSSPNPYKDAESQSPAVLRSEEYRQLFRLPPEEVLLEDFNCACQENILVQGHMYLFVRYICFYSNIFGYETKKTIPFHEVTSVRRAKTAGIFPNAIEISAGDRKFFFASFLSRDEAFRLINEGLSRLSDGAKEITEQQESTTECSGQENGLVAVEKVKSPKQQINELESTDGNKDAPSITDSELPSSIEDGIMPASLPEQQDNIEQDTGPAPNTKSSSSGDIFTWKQENDDAPEIKECYTKVAESMFPIKVEDFFKLFISDDAVSFIESFHQRCGDKEFRCTPWKPHEEFGHVRDVSFQHPIKIYFGAKFGGCQESQKFRVYRNSHLVVETSQEIVGVPYADYFRVEALWDVQRIGEGSKEGCFLRVYVNVAFSKKTVWKGKIMTSTLEECQEAYEIWTEMAHELLKQKNLEKQEVEGNPAPSTIQNGEVKAEREAKPEEPLERSHRAEDHRKIPHIADSVNVNVNRIGTLFHERLIDAASVASFFKELMANCWSSLKSQTHLPPLLVIACAVILLMQLSILVLLARPQQVHVVSHVDHMSGIGGRVSERSAENTAWLEKRIFYLKDEMRMVETWIERMRLEHAILKAQLRDLEHRRSYR